MEEVVKKSISVAVIVATLAAMIVMIYLTH